MNRYSYIGGEFERPEAIDLPTCQDAFGNKLWYKDNKFEINFSGSMDEWGKLDRVSGPSIEWADGSREWHLNGRWHRVDGPAIEWANGNKSWYLNNNRLTEEEFNAIPIEQRSSYRMPIEQV